MATLLSSDSWTGNATVSKTVDSWLHNGCTNAPKHASFAPKWGLSPEGNLLIPNTRHGDREICYTVVGPNNKEVLLAVGKSSLRLHTKVGSGRFGQNR